MYTLNLPEGRKGNFHICVITIIRGTLSHLNVCINICPPVCSTSCRLVGEVVCFVEDSMVDSGTNVALLQPLMLLTGWLKRDETVIAHLVLVWCKEVLRNKF